MRVLSYGGRLQLSLRAGRMEGGPSVGGGSDSLRGVLGEGSETDNILPVNHRETCQGGSEAGSGASGRS